MNGAQEVDICSVCGKRGSVIRTYYHYNVPCECCLGGRHFEIVRTCPDCKPVPPRRISVVAQPDPPPVADDGRKTCIDLGDGGSIDALAPDEPNPWMGSGKEIAASFYGVRVDDERLLPLANAIDEEIARLVESFGAEVDALEKAIESGDPIDELLVRVRDLRHIFDQGASPPPVADDAREVGEVLYDYINSKVYDWMRGPDGQRIKGIREQIIHYINLKIAARDEAVRRGLLDAISKRHEETSRKAKRSAYHEGYADGMAEAKAIARAAIEGTAKGGA